MLGVPLERIVVSINKQSNSCPEASKYLQRSKHPLDDCQFHLLRGDTLFRFLIFILGSRSRIHLLSSAMKGELHTSILRSGELASIMGLVNMKRVPYQGSFNTRGGGSLILHRNETKLQRQMASSECLKKGVSTAKL